MFYGKKHFISRLHTKGNYNIAITKGVFEHFHLRSCDRVIYDGPLDTSKLKNSVNKQNVVLFVGNFLRGKRVDLAISAFALFHKQFPQYKLLLVGDMLDTHYTQECKNLVEKNGLDQSVCFMGRRQDVYDLMSVSKMLIVPSNFEGFGFVTVEGMANNCLVIGRNTAGTKEQMDKGLKECGHEIAYRFNNLDELVNCMLRAAETDTSQLRTFAKNVVLTNYTKEIHARRVISFYKDILSDYNLKYARG